MNAPDFYARILLPAHDFLRSIAPHLASADAARELLAICGQESSWTHRRQIPGPARGFWQMEPNGVLAVLTNPATGPTLIAAARALSIGTDRASIYTAIEYCDPLAYVAGRLLLVPLPEPLPVTQDDGWSQYVAAWRPGRPRPEDWAPNWAAAVGCVAMEAP